MAQKTFSIDGIGDVILQKRRGTKNLRISITPDGRVKVGMPTWLPYSTGIAFARQKREWVLLQTRKRQIPQLLPGARVGKYHRIVLSNVTSDNTTVKIVDNTILLRTNYSVTSKQVQLKLTIAAEKALKIEALSLLPKRVESLAKQHHYQYSELSIKKLTSRWGSCSAQGKITLSYFLIQLPWSLIDYVIIHELAHTKHLNHSKSFWDQVASSCQDYKNARKQIKNYSPAVKPEGMA